MQRGSLSVVGIAVAFVVAAWLGAAGWTQPGGAPLPSAASPRSGELVVVEGTILSPTGDAGAEPQRCAGSEAQGVVGHVLAEVTPGATFALRATGERAEEQDFDLVFYRRLTPCPADAEPTAEQPVGGLGDDAGVVPPDATAAIVYLFAGAAGTFLYHEFPPLGPPDTPLVLENTLHFRPRPVTDARSTYHDLYEPHLAIAGTGALYLTGHTASSNTHRSPAFVSTDDGASWRLLPDPEPLPTQSTQLPVLGGRVGQGNEAGIAADAAGRAWLYDAAWAAGTAPLYGWCDDGARSCHLDAAAYDFAALATQGCAEQVRLLDRPWARASEDKVLLSNIGLRSGFVDEFRAVAMLGVVDPATGAKAWDTCVAVGGMPGVPALRESDGWLALPQVLRTPDGEGWVAVHHGPSPGALTTSPPVVRAPKSWQLCQHFSTYSDFSAAGTYYVFTGAGPRLAAVSASADLERFATLTFDPGGVLRYMWLEGSQLGEGALLTWGAAEDCDAFTPTTFYAAHVVLEDGALALRDASVVAAGLKGTCGHYMGSDLGPDGRAYLVVHASPGACLGAVPTHAPLTHAPWTLYVQDEGPRR